MQQLLGDKATNTDVAVMRKLFLLHLPSDVRVVLASMLGNESIEDLVQLTGKIMEVAVPSVANVTTYLHGIATAPPRSNWFEMHDCYNLLNYITQRRSRSCPSSPPHILNCHRNFVGIMPSLVIKNTSASPHAASGKMPRPGINGNWRCWPQF